MKIDIDKIDEGRFVIREENNTEYIDQLSQSLQSDGQWNPIIVRPKEGGRYEVIAGHYRLKAAKKAGFKEVEATVRDLPDEEADVLSIKTNLLRMEMTVREQGKVLSKMMESYGWNQTELARKLNVGQQWVARRLRVALELHEEVAKALDQGKIGFQVAAIIAGIAPEEQLQFMQIIIKKGITDHTDAGLLRRQYLNDTIYTIGYQGKNIEQFIKILKENEIELLLDARFSSESQYKPEFSGNVLEREIKRNKMNYNHEKELGLPYLIQNPYKEGVLGYNCVKQWYNWHINTNTNFEKLIELIKTSGKTAIMCMEAYAKAHGEQRYACHRDMLADMIVQHNPEDKLLKFSNRVDL